MEVFTKKINRVYEPDVLVCGLGPAGIGAAVAAARSGAKTMAIDRGAYSGGNFTSAKVIGICGEIDHLTGRMITGGITFEMLKRAAYKREDDGSHRPFTEILKDNPNLMNPVYKPLSAEEHAVAVNGVCLLFDPEIFKYQADQLLLESGVKLLYNTVVADTVVSDGHIDKVILAAKDGLSCVKPKVVIDCTGDADIAAMAGAPFEIAETVQPGTMMFTVGGLVFDDAPAFFQQCRDAMAKAAETGEVDIYTGPSIGILQPGMCNFNNTRIVFDASSSESVTNGEIVGRREVFRFFEVYQKYVPAFQNAYILESGPYLGTRESRRIIGDYVLTLEDMAEGKHFEDTIALAGGLVDFHDLKENGYSRLRYLKPSGIPYRTLLPQKVENLLVAGRCHSVTQQGASSTRMGVTAMLMGEAAGRAAALAVSGRCSPREVDVGQLRDQLLKHNAILSV